jgi:DNA invertase Pin-like site-specific DNA recombinase
VNTTPLAAAEAATARWKEAKDALDAAKELRDQAIRQADKSGCAQTDIVKATGLTRETIRRITNPEAAAAVRNAQRSTQKEAR